ncbi:hypothetical protein PAECIP111893_03853 [Paenibacillus plantiphilus]|uniref:Cysteine-rich CPCC domain-containing protein n=2 Tax=Paenibacillus plantiphilus TaxID=2905650 RepID=A0ABN8GRR9_9BACL|nr:hypothetical protein PAECIP111893_03853 [Paenibacillus plantiphilus]
MLKHTCPCCGYDTLDSDGHYDICKICYWEDDPYQKENPYSEGGANHISLAEAQINYLTYGACEKNYTDLVRESIANDTRNPDWKPALEDKLFELKLACRKFIRGNIGIEKLEHNLSWIGVPNEHREIVKEVERQLEIIRFCSIDYKQHNEALDVVNDMLKKLNIVIEGD